MMRGFVVGSCFVASTIIMAAAFRTSADHIQGIYDGQYERVIDDGISKKRTVVAERHALVAMMGGTLVLQDQECDIRFEQRSRAGSWIMTGQNVATINTIYTLRVTSATLEQSGSQIHVRWTGQIMLGNLTSQTIKGEFLGVKL